MLTENMRLRRLSAYSRAAGLSCRAICDAHEPKQPKTVSLPRLRPAGHLRAAGSEVEGSRQWCLPCWPRLTRRCQRRFLQDGTGNLCASARFHMIQYVTLTLRVLRASRRAREIAAAAPWAFCTRPFLSPPPPLLLPPPPVVSPAPMRPGHPDALSVVAPACCAWQVRGCASLLWQRHA